MSHDYYCWLFPDRKLRKSEAYVAWTEIMREFKGTPARIMSGGPDYTSTDLEAAEHGDEVGPNDDTEMLTYRLRGQEVDFWLHSLFPDGTVKIAVLSVAEYSLSAQRMDFAEELLEIIDRMHARFASKRTMLGWELGELGDFDPHRELAALSDGRLDGLYWLDIAASRLVDEERLGTLESYAERAQDCILTRLPNGDFKFRHSFFNLAGF